MPDDGGAGQVVGGGTTREYILEDDECPLAILMNHPASRGAVTFHVRRRPPDGQRRRKKKSSSIGQLGKKNVCDGKKRIDVDPDPTFLLDLDFPSTFNVKFWVKKVLFIKDESGTCPCRLITGTTFRLSQLHF